MGCRPAFFGSRCFKSDSSKPCRALVCLLKTPKYLSQRELYLFSNSSFDAYFSRRTARRPGFGRPFTAELQLENLALRQQINVLRRSLKKRPKLSSGDRLFWVSLSRLWRDWPSTLVIVKPETVVAWHRKGFRLLWTR